MEQFKSDVGATLPPARVAALAFDKLDVEKGMEVRGPQGELRWLKHPWSVLAFQIAGAAGIRGLHAEGQGRGARDGAGGTAAGRFCWRGPRPRGWRRSC